MSRDYDFTQIKKVLSPHCFYEDGSSIVVKGDSLEVLKSIPDQTISLILTDPPYHSTKKDNIINDKSFDSDDKFISWIESYAYEWRRIIKPNGSVFMFCSSAMEAKLEMMLSRYFNILTHIVWTKPNDPGFDGWKGKMRKESLRQWYPHSERIIFFEPKVEGENLTYFSSMLREKRQECGISGHDLTERIGAYGKINHGGAVSNWESGRNIPSKEQYCKICAVLKEIKPSISMPQYEDAIRPFEVNSQVEFTDVWTFPSVRPYKGKHPAEKPLNMLEHCINSTTFEGDIVLDCFAGSGSSLIAALRTQRRAIGIEIDKVWCESIKKRIIAVQALPPEISIPREKIMKLAYSTVKTPTLFDGFSI